MKFSLFEIIKKFSRTDSYPNIVFQVKKKIDWNIREILKRKSGLSGVAYTLVVTHGQGGGTDFFCAEFVARLIAAGESVLVLTPIPHQEKVSLTFYRGGPAEIFSVRNIKDLNFIFQELNICHIAINHFKFFSNILKLMQYIRELKYKKNIKISLYFHDYFFICRRYTLINYKNEFCNIPPLTECEKCLIRATKKTKVYFEKYIDQGIWREEINKLFRIVNKYIFFSDASFKYYQKVYCIDMSRCTVRAHDASYITRIPKNIFSTRRLVIGILGTITVDKGLLIVYDLVNIIKKNSLRIQVVIIGSVSDEIERTIESDCLVVHGRYSRTDLPDLVEKYSINIIFIPSIWPETFSYTTEEAIKMNMPVAVFDIGAPSERVRGYSNGIIIPLIQAGVALSSMRAYGDSRLNGMTS